MNAKTFLGIGLAAAASLVLAFVILNRLNGVSGAESGSQPPRSETPESRPPSAAVAGPSAGIPVTPQDLENLARMVDLSESPDQGFKKEQWAKAIPAAEKLLGQSCDCEQRNWLTQFVNVGHLAAAESPDYRTFAPMLATMYRDNHERITGLPSN
jgi:hypothetical protein